MTTTARTITEAEFRTIAAPLNDGRRSSVSAFPVDATELTTFAHELAAGGYNLGPRLSTVLGNLDAAEEQFQRASNRDAFAGFDLAKATPAATVAAVRDAAVNAAIRDRALSEALSILRTAALPALREALAATCDSIVASVRPDFDDAVAVVKSAHEAGLTPHTTRDDVLNTGDANAIAAYRALTDAVHTLDRLARLRIRMSNIAHVGGDNPIAGLVAPGQDLEGAAGVYTGDAETVLVTNTVTAVGPAVRQVPRPRLGGPWLALVAAGYHLHLHTDTAKEN